MQLSLKTGSAALLGLCLSSASYAADIDEPFTPSPTNDRIERGFYVAASVRPEVFILDLSDGNTGDLVANTFAGIGGSAQLCKRGVGSANFIDLCAGGHIFTSLTSGSEQINSQAVGGPITSETDILTYGGFVQAKLHGNRVFAAPYAGFRRIQADVTFSTPVGGAVTANLNDTSNAFFGGAELGFNAFNKRVELGVSGEVGTSISSDNDFNYYKAGAFLRAKF